jgi:Ca-activated chloride channel family protein
MIGFEDPFYLFALAFVIAIIIFVYFFSLKHSRKRALKFANFEAIERVTGAQILSKNLTSFYLRIFIVLLLVLALSGIKFNYVGLTTDETYILAIDTSMSMSAVDIPPSRLEVAKNAAIKFIDDTPQGSEIGIISFAGTAFIEKLIDTDKEKLKRVIQNIELKESGGTDILATIILSKNILKTSDKTGAIILLTDGQFNIQTLEEVLIYLESTPVYTLGIGTKEGGKFAEGVVSRLEEETLQTVANYTGGAYYKVNTQEEIENAYSEIIILKKEGKEMDLSIWFLIISICLLLIDWTLINTKYKTLP